MFPNQGFKHLALKDEISGVSPDHSSSPNHLLTNLIYKVARAVSLMVKSRVQRSLFDSHVDDMLT